MEISKLIEQARLSDEEITDIWHTRECSNANDGSWHYRLSTLREIAKAQLSKARVKLVRQ